MATQQIGLCSGDTLNRTEKIKNVGILPLLVPRIEALALPIEVRRAMCRAHVYMQIYTTGIMSHDKSQWNKYTYP
ncbi:MAG: hypothetical protein K2M07_03800 [Muribaculaceae bacterium]|nr:hypothetical protein [Muribaculaceae bacterium]